MSYDLMLWRPRAGTRRTPGFVYLVLVEGVPCDGVEPLDVAAVERDLDEALPRWRSGDEGLTVDLSTACVQVSVGGGDGGDRALEAVRAIGVRRGLEVFDPQGQPVSTKDGQAATKYIETQAGYATEEQVGVWRRAAEQGDAAAMNELGNAYSWGEGVREDATIAAQWYARAAALNHPGAMANLAECYRCGEGVAQDAALAARWFEEAGSHGDLEALVRLAEFLRSGNKMPKAPDRARVILERALEGDRQVSAFMLAEMNESGEGGPRDIDRAKQLYRLALEHRHPEARLRLRRLGVDA
jgi:hypothetical protein